MTDMDESEYGQTKKDALASLKEANLDLVENVICPLIEASQRDVVSMIEEAEELQSLVAQGGSLAENWSAYATALMSELGWISDKGEVTEKIPEKYKVLFQQLVVAHKEFNDAMDQYEADEEEGEENE